MAQTYSQLSYEPSNSTMEFMAHEQQTWIGSTNKGKASERSIKILSVREDIKSPEESEVFSSAVKRERINFLNAFQIEQVWAEMKRIKENKQKVDLMF